MVASAVYILDSRGKMLIARDYRGEVSMTAVEEFTSRFQEQEELDELPIYVRHASAIKKKKKKATLTYPFIQF